ncbi:MAG: hypothetical protein IKN96_02900 [Oscillibacter sp.]|nr:hypothetical protein [Oscillibacter sp.]
MSSYARLLLSAGGGVISAGQQAEQARNTASILIGLGGTGVHCIRTIKTQVYDRLKPDIPGAAAPTYSHIRFLGVDSAEASRRGALRQDPNKRPDNAMSAEQIMPLADSEFFSIANNQLQRAFQNKQALRHRKELSWLEYETIRLPDLTDAGAGGIRQVGRFMFMDRAGNFVGKLEQEIEKAKIGLNNPRVNIHIFSGLSGGTGSGCFLDVCYLIRSVADRLGAVTIFGYFFLPDVNLWPVPRANSSVRDYICKNGYASMQELDYCMNLQFNGGGFAQTYQANRPPVPWTAAPVDMCHLICATDQDNNSIAQAYDYAMNVTAEYLMDFLTDSNSAFDLQQHLSNFQSMIGEANQKKLTGACMDYCIIGAACASVPLREINTYLASELFHEFAGIRKNRPEQAEAESVCFGALAPGAETAEEAYNALFGEIRRDAAPEDYAPYPHDWKFVRDYGGKDMAEHYAKQTALKKARIQANAKRMSDAGGADSLLQRVRNALEPVIRDLSRGPLYAYGIVSAGEKHNLIALIDGWIRQNDERYEAACRNTQERQQNYDNARMNFEGRSRGLFGNRARFEAYEYYLSAHEQHELELAACQQLKRVLLDFREQIMEAASAYYVRLSRVMGNLTDTFEDNRQALASHALRRNLEGFAAPMMSVTELKPALDAEIRRLDAANMFNDFMTRMLGNADEWLQEDESRIARLVTDFFLNTAFGNFANRTITNFLRDKYEAQEGARLDDDALSQRVYNDWIRPLTEKARPLFYFNNSIWQESGTSKLAFLSYPAESAPIAAAARRRNAEDSLWGLKTSALTDRIFVMSSACGLPLSAYNNCQAYEQMFYSSRSVGRHSYEGKPVPGMPFNDWRNLPSIMPQSVLSKDCGDLPPDLRTRILSARELWARTRERRLLDDESAFYDTPDPDGLRDACALCRTLAARTQSPDDMPALYAVAADLRERLNRPLAPTGGGLPQDGDRSEEEIILRVQEDHFVSSPAYHAGILRTLETLDAAEAALSAAADKEDEMKRLGERQAQEAEARKRLMNDYCEALFTGVLEMSGRAVTYPNDGMPVTLCEFSGEYPYARIPVYQAFLNYRKLSSEAQARIRREYQKRYRENAPELRAAGGALKEALPQNRQSILMELAGNWDNGAEIQAFLKDFFRRFQMFCLDNEI